MKKKRAWLKTVEVLFIVIITSVFFLYFIPQYTEDENTNTNKNQYLSKIEKIDGFRDNVITKKGCYFQENATDLNLLIEKYLPQEYDYALCISEIYHHDTDTKVFIDSLYISGNITQFNPKIIRLYYWND